MFRLCSYTLILLLAQVPLFQIATARATATKTEEFREHYEQALKDYAQGEYLDSIKEFQKAYAIRQLPKLLINLGKVHRKLGLAREALGYYEQYLRVEPNPEPMLKRELDQHIVQMRAMLETASKKESEAAARSQKESEAAAPLKKESEAAASLAALQPQVDSHPKRPVYKRPWFWGVMAVAGAVVVGGVVTGAVLGTRAPPDSIMIKDWSLRSQP